MPSAPARIDPRGTRVAAVLTAAVLAVALVTASVWVVAAQTVVFAIGAVVGPHATPYAWLYRVLVRPRLGPPAELEAAAPPRFAQAVGLVFGLVATVGFATGLTAVGLVATALAFAAAFLNAAFGFCLGCEIYLVARRLLHRSTPDQHTSAAALAASKEVHA
jgi:hypothetical protein